MGEVADAIAKEKAPLLKTQSESDAEGTDAESEGAPLSLDVKRTGTVWTAVAHIVTGVIGSGVLSLAWSIAQLGWVAGPLAMILFASITLFSAFLLCNSYRSPDPQFGPRRSSSYLDAANLHLETILCGYWMDNGTSYGL